MLRATGICLGSLALLALACGQDEQRRSGADYATELQGCDACQAILVECTSTSHDDAEFAGCRDLWQTCQDSRGLDGSECKNPGDDDACALCRTRLTACVETDGADAARCEDEFGVCKAFLITRGDVQARCAKAAEPPPEVACAVCQRDLAICVSDPGSAVSACASKLDLCRQANGLTPIECAWPSGEPACTLCTEQHASCEASAGPNCAAGFGTCADAIAGGVSCTLPSTCDHGVCVVGAALTSGCDADGCVEAVCNYDAWCCDNEWDEYCVLAARDIPACGCA